MTDHRPTSDEDVTHDVSRRTLIKGAAWAAPVIAVALSTPASAASTVVDPALIDLIVYKEGELGFNHGFTIANLSTTDTFVVPVSFVGRAIGLDDDRARENLTSATDQTFATNYSEQIVLNATADPAPRTYQQLWNDDLNAADNVATRSGQATFTLPPGSSYTFLQSNFSALGLPSITATVAIDGGVTRVLQLP